MPNKKMSDIEDKIKSLEVSLHESEVRSNPKRIIELLHKDFREIGYSGSTYDLSAILTNLTGKNSESQSIWSQEFEFDHLSSEIIQVHYLSAHIKNGELTRHAKRTSIWVKEGAEWLLRYHQGTPTSSFIKMMA